MSFLVWDGGKGKFVEKIGLLINWRPEIFYSILLLFISEAE